MERGKTTKMTKCNNKCEIYSRIVGYHRPISMWNKGKKEEYAERTPYTPTEHAQKHT
jgi:anaerobic ribonucleoside-triphosphate reductase